VRWLRLGEERKERKKDREKKPQDENIMSASAFCCRFTQVVLEVK